MNQRGQVLLTILFILLVAGVAGFYTFARAPNRHIESDRITTMAMAEVKDALIGRAASDIDRPGSLPCPDTTNDGTEDWDASNNNCASYVGRVPWKDLGIPPPIDGNGEILWYALSPTFRDRSQSVAGVLNSDTVGQLQIVGASPASKAVAILFAAGEVVDAQTRGGAGANNPHNYLEGENTNGDAKYIGVWNPQLVDGKTVNDRAFALTSEDVFRVVDRRVVKEVKRALDDYGSAYHYFPQANKYTNSNYSCDNDQFSGRLPIDPSTCSVGVSAMEPWGGRLPDWYIENEWNTVTYYAVSESCAIRTGITFLVDPILKSLCETNFLPALADLLKLLFREVSAPLTVSGVTTNAKVVIVVTGGARGAQVHNPSCTTESQCIEDGENNDLDHEYMIPSRYPDSNDYMGVLCASSSPCP